LWVNCGYSREVSLFVFIIARLLSDIDSYMDGISSGSEYLEEFLYRSMAGKINRL